MPYLGTAPTPFASPETFEDVYAVVTPSNVFTLNRDVTSKSDIIVSINGVVQHTHSYEVSGSGNRTITLDNNCVENDELRVLHLGFKAISINTGAPDDDSVTAQKLTVNSVSTVKIQDDAVTGTKIADASIGANHLDPSFVTAGPSLGTNSIIRTNAKTIDEDIVFTGNENGMTVGPITISPNYSVQVVSGSTWTII